MLLPVVISAAEVIDTLVAPHRKRPHPHPAIDLRSRFVVGFADVDCIEQDLVFGGE
jgi:hypothetical protein